MPSPVTIAELEAELPLATDDFCTAIEKAGRFDALMARIYAWMRNEDGTLTTEFNTELCGACSTTTTSTTTTTTTVTTSTTTTTTTAGCAYATNNIPQMTSDTTPEGYAYASYGADNPPEISLPDAWKAFDRNDLTYVGTPGSVTTLNIKVGYSFTSAKIIRKIRVKGFASGSVVGPGFRIVLRGTNDGVNFSTIGPSIFPTMTDGNFDVTQTYSNSISYLGYEVNIFSFGTPSPNLFIVNTVEMYEC